MLRRKSVISLQRGRNMKNTKRRSKVGSKMPWTNMRPQASTKCARIQFRQLTKISADYSNGLKNLSERPKESVAKFFTKSSPQGSNKRRWHSVQRIKKLLPEAEFLEYCWQKNLVWSWERRRLFVYSHPLSLHKSQLFWMGVQLFQS